MMKKNNTASIKSLSGKKVSNRSWKQRRELLTNNISLEVDLENRQLFFSKNSNETMNLSLNTDNLDQVITSYLAPQESKKVIQRLSKAEKGLEEPIPFNFKHPNTSKVFHFEYRYKIVYVKYSSTRLKGELVKTKSNRSKK